VTSTTQIKAFALRRAAELGFACAGVATAGAAAHGEAFRRWLAAGRHASMDYLARGVERRCDLRAAWPWAASVLCLGAGYAPPGGSVGSAVARYARGRDYHRVLKRLAHRLADELAERVDGLQTRVCVDTAPLLERDWAAAAGLGWIGKNACLIHPTYGSWLLLAEIVLSIDLPPDAPCPDACGDCRRCLDACPNAALGPGRTLDAARCNSWATIENRGPLDGEAFGLRGQLFGCDLCQLACPHNRDTPEGMAELTARKPVAEADALAVLNWSAEDWDAATRGSAARRASWALFARNAAIAAGQAGGAEAEGPLRRLAECDEEPIVAAAAKWALRQIAGKGA